MNSIKKVFRYLTQLLFVLLIMQYLDLLPFWIRITFLIIGTSILSAYVTYKLIKIKKED